MKSVKLFIVLLSLLMLTACDDYGEKRIVKLVTVDNEKISFYYYDFTSDKPAFIAEQKENTGLENTMTDILSQNDYDLKLCNFVVCDKSITDDNMYELASALINCRFSPDVCVIEGNTKEEYEKYIDKSKTNYPLFSYKINNNRITGVVENIDSNSKHIIYNNEIVKTFDARQSFVIDAITDTINKGVYTFENQGKTLTANLENINTVYSTENGRVKITLSAILKSYKGMPANKKSKEQFIYMLEYNLDKDIREIYDDGILVESLNLDWFTHLYGNNRIKVNIVIK